ncbi:MAG: hypothetical protein AAGJ18_16530, partial [Bacteroidota bacterium]
VDHTWIYDIIADLINIGTYEDDKAFDENLLPIVKQLLVAIIPTFEKNHAEDWWKSDVNYIQFSDYQAKLLHALVNYSLRVNRVEKSKGNSITWDTEIRNLIDQAFQKQLLGGYTILGRLYRNLGFLDENWTYEKIELAQNASDDLWYGFILRLPKKPPVPKKSFYDLMIPHYRRALQKIAEGDSFIDGRVSLYLLHHCFADYENIGAKGLIDKFLDVATASQMQEFILLIYHHQDYYKSLQSSKEKTRFRTVVYQIWSYLLKLYGKTGTDEMKGVLAKLKLLIIFVEELDSQNVKLIVGTVKVLKSWDGIYELLERLKILSEKGTPKKTAKHLSQILQSLPVVYLDRRSKENLTALVFFLYEHNSKLDANKICDKYLKAGDNFLIPVYDENNA